MGAETAGEAGEADQAMFFPGKVDAPDQPVAVVDVENQDADSKLVIGHRGVGQADVEIPLGPGGCGGIRPKARPKAGAESRAGDQRTAHGGAAHEKFTAIEIHTGLGVQICAHESRSSWRIRLKREWRDCGRRAEIAIQPHGLASTATFTEHNLDLGNIACTPKINTETGRGARASGR